MMDSLAIELQKNIARYVDIETGIALCLVNKVFHIIMNDKDVIELLKIRFDIVPWCLTFPELIEAYDCENDSPRSHRFKNSTQLFQHASSVGNIKTMALAIDRGLEFDWRVTWSVAQYFDEIKPEWMPKLLNYTEYMIRGYIEKGNSDDKIISLLYRLSLTNNNFNMVTQALCEKNNMKYYTI